MRKFLGQEGAYYVDPITGQQMFDSAYSDPGVPTPAAPAYPFSAAEDADLEAYFNSWVWPKLQNCVTSSEIDDVLIGANAQIDAVLPFSSQTEHQAQAIAKLTDDYSQRAYTFLETGTDPWSMTARASKAFDGKVGLAMGVTAAAVVVHRLLAGEWIWSLLRR